MNFLRPLLAASKALLVLTLVLGVGYPLLITALAQLLPGRAEGSIITVAGQPVGSALLGQHVTSPGLFHGRPSTSEASGETSGGSNLGPSSAKLAALVGERQAAVQAANPDASGPIPPDALTASSSGLDPHISPEYAAYQAPRVASATGHSLDQVEELIDAHTTEPVLGFLGNASVNVTELNADLAATMAGQE